MDKDELESVLDKYRRGICTPEEKKFVEDWYDSFESRPVNGLSPSRQSDVYTSLTRRIEEEARLIRSLPTINRRKFILKAVAVAAAVLLLSGSAYYLIHLQKPGEIKIAETKPIVPQDLPPGGEKATLTLGDGTVISLDDAKNGVLARQGNSRLIKLKSGELSYETGKKNGEVIPFNTISTPRGGQYQVMLPDRSRVWLNAASSIKFPASFASGERKIELSGEAYFEITHDAKKPFRVVLASAGAQNPPCTIEVLGTHFNVMAYADERMIKTTLLEGSVRLNADHFNKILKPGEQAEILPDYSSAIIQRADLEETMAWKNDLFWFNRADIKSVMRQISRWYDVDIRYEGNISKTFRGSVPRKLSAAKLFNILEQTGGVHFKIQDKTVIVMP